MAPEHRAQLLLQMVKQRMLWFPGSPSAKPARNFRGFISFFFLPSPFFFNFSPFLLHFGIAGAWLLPFPVLAPFPAQAKPDFWEDAACTVLLWDDFSSSFFFFFFWLLTWISSLPSLASSAFSSRLVCFGLSFLQT